MEMESQAIFKPNQEPNFFLLNCVPGPGRRSPRGCPASLWRSAGTRTPRASAAAASEAGRGGDGGGREVAAAAVDNVASAEAADGAAQSRSGRGRRRCGSWRTAPGSPARTGSAAARTSTVCRTRLRGGIFGDVAPSVKRNDRI